MKVKRRKLTALEQQIIHQRANKCCEYCKFLLDYSHDAFHIEHIIPLTLDGTYELFNLALACDGCNSHKSVLIEGIDAQTGLKSRLFNPRKDIWSEHFIWTDNFSKIQGITPEGRATVDLLQMNRTGLFNVRKALRVYGVHPPE